MVICTPLNILQLKCRTSLPLMILLGPKKCVERERESYGNLPGAQKTRDINYWHELGIEYVGASDMLTQLCL